MKDDPLHFTLWDVGYGISIWIRTPNGQDHWIDLGRTSEFSPSEYVSKTHSLPSVDYLIISRPDKDHLEDLTPFRDCFRLPERLYFNHTIPETDLFGDLTQEYQQKFVDIARKFVVPSCSETSPTCPSQNGGIRYAIHDLDHGSTVSDAVLPGSPAIEKNNTSVVVMLLYAGVLFVCPGDIEPLGWRELWHHHSASYQHLIAHSHARFLVAPHRGHKRAYCEEMMQAIKPHATFINDVWGESEVHPSYRDDPIGIPYRQSGCRRSFSTRRAGFVQITVFPSGEHSILQRN